MDETMVLKKNSNIVTRVIEDETILLPIYKTSEEINCIYTLDKTASFVWKLIDGKKPYSAIKREVLEEFDASGKEVDEQMELLLKDLKEIKAVI